MVAAWILGSSPSMTKARGAPFASPKTERPAFRRAVRRQAVSPITEPGQVPVLAQGPARVQVPELAREPGQAPERVPARGPEQALQAQEPACWRPAAQPEPGHARRRFCQKHNTQQWPG